MGLDRPGLFCNELEVLRFGSSPNETGALIDRN